MDAINIHQTIRTKLNVLIEANYDLNETEDRLVWKPKQNKRSERNLTNDRSGFIIRQLYGSALSKLIELELLTDGLTNDQRLCPCHVPTQLILRAEDKDKIADAGGKESTPVAFDRTNIWSSTV
ncbi:hypothetical protein BLOT_003004 [Blomia tropicalis]|nr:hypothetical protein BLOT_003004 [Blomia tropicalis]